MKEYLIIKDNGAALVITMMVLLMLNIIGLAAISTTSTELNIAGNERTSAQAHQSAEAGIKEVIYRMGLTSNTALTIANGGSKVAINGITNAWIGDSGIKAGAVGGVACSNAKPCPNPTWETRAFYMNAPPGGTPYTATTTILPSGEWSSMNYSATSTTDANNALTVRYMTENDLNADLNGDGDKLDIVYYNTATKAREVNTTNKTNGVADVHPTLAKDTAIMLITSTGRSGSAQKRVIVEVTSFPVNIKVDGGVSAGVNITLTGNSFASGFNHMADTIRADETNRKTNFADPFPTANTRDNWSGGGADETQAQISASADYSGKWESSGHVPGAITTPAKTVSKAGSSEVWGDYSCGANCTAWKSEGFMAVFPDLETLLGIDTATLNQILARADITNANASSPANGVTYIQNAGGQTYTPAGSSGWGLMVVEGDFKVQANYEFRGLIYVKGNADVRGGFWLLGAMAVKGSTDLKFAAGTPTVLYSTGSLDQNVKRAIQNVGFAFTTLSWREG